VHIKILARVCAEGCSCFDGLSTNGKSAAIAVTTPFALSLSKGERRIYQKIDVHPLTAEKLTSVV
jgi:hypothetical protein